MRYRLQRHDGTDCSATMVPITVLRMVPIQRYRHVRVQKIPCFSFVHIDNVAKSRRFFTIKVSTYKIFTLYFILRQVRKADKTSGKSLIFLYKEVQLL